MQNPSFQSQFKVTFNDKEYPVVFLIDFVNGLVSFQDTPYHPSEIHTKPISEVTLTYTPQ